MAAVHSCDASAGTNGRPEPKTSIGAINVVGAKGQSDLGREVIPDPAADRPKIAGIAGGTEVEIIHLEAGAQLVGDLIAANRRSARYFRAAALGVKPANQVNPSFAARLEG